MVAGRFFYLINRSTARASVMKADKYMYNLLPHLATWTDCRPPRACPHQYRSRSSLRYPMLKYHDRRYLSHPSLHSILQCFLSLDLPDCRVNLSGTGIRWE